MKIAKGSNRVDWQAERDRIDLAAVATSLLGPAPGRRGERGSRLWWSCPFHEDSNPSFCVEPGKSWFACYGCGKKGDAATLVMGVQGCTFPEALAFLVGGKPLSGSSRRPAPRSKSKPPPAPAGPVGMTPEAAVALVAESSDRLWSPEGADALAYLMGADRNLTPETIRAARLGFADRIEARTADGHPYTACGIVVPWFTGNAPTLVKVRQFRGWNPKYAEVYRDRSRWSGLYPGPEAIRPGLPLVIVEGEFDARLLGQELAALASVVTLGSASSHPGPDLFGKMLVAAPWFIATDSDPAGDRAASEWPPSARRVRPPATSRIGAMPDAATSRSSDGGATSSRGSRHPTTSPGMNSPPSAGTGRRRPNTRNRHSCSVKLQVAFCINSGQ